jgi:hypothetical protein
MGPAAKAQSAPFFINLFEGHFLFGLMGAHEKNP